MKRTIVIILAMLLLVTFSACDSGKKAAFDAAKTAYDSINAAYETTEKWVATLTRYGDWEYIVKTTY